MQTKTKKNEEIRNVEPQVQSDVVPVKERDRNYAIYKAFYDNAHDDGFHHWRIASIPAQLLQVDSAYQRKLDMGHVREICAGWQPDKCEPLEVNLRVTGEGFFVMDGAHRLTAAKMLGIEMVPCHIYLGLTQEEEANFFALQGDGRKNPTSFNKFKARCVAGDETALIVKRMCDKYRVGYDKRQSNSYPTLGGMSTIMDVCSKYGEAGVAWVFETIKLLTWHEDRKAYSAAIIWALGNVYGMHENKGKAMSNLVSVLDGRKHKPEDVIAKALTERQGRGLYRALTQYFENCIQCE